MKSLDSTFNEMYSFLINWMIAIIWGHYDTEYIRVILRKFKSA